MALKKIFKKKKSNKKNFYIIIFFIITFLAFFYFLLFYERLNYIILPADDNKFYVIPNDRGGEKVEYLDKKSLNLKSEQEFVKIYNLPEDSYFSIQFYTDNDLKKVEKYIDKLINEDELIYDLKDFFIMAFNSEIGTDYFLLYKSFLTIDLAKKYCVNFLSKLDRCLIVDTTKF